MSGARSSTTPGDRADVGHRTQSILAVKPGCRPNGSASGSLLEGVAKRLRELSDGPQATRRMNVPVILLVGKALAQRSGSRPSRCSCPCLSRPSGA